VVLKSVLFTQSYTITYSGFS